jgi:hypothetical protein
MSHTHAGIINSHKKVKKTCVDCGKEYETAINMRSRSVRCRGCQDERTMERARERKKDKREKGAYNKTVITICRVKCAYCGNMFTRTSEWILSYCCKEHYLLSFKEAYGVGDERQDTPLVPA